MVNAATQPCARTVGVPFVSITSRQEFKMAFILVVAGTALAFYVALLIIERENAATLVLGSQVN
jgi:hypothetical protein